MYVTRMKAVLLASRKASPVALSMPELYQLCSRVSKSLLIPIAEVKAAWRPVKIAENRRKSQISSLVDSFLLAFAFEQGLLRLTSTTSELLSWMTTSRSPPRSFRRR